MNTRLIERKAVTMTATGGLSPESRVEVQFRVKRSDGTLEDWDWKCSREECEERMDAFIRFLLDPQREHSDDVPVWPRWVKAEGTR